MSILGLARLERITRLWATRWLFLAVLSLSDHATMGSLSRTRRNWRMVDFDLNFQGLTHHARTGVASGKVALSSWIHFV